MDISNHVKMTSDVPQESVIGLLKFLAFMNDIMTGMYCNIELFGDDSINYNKIESIDDFNILQANLRKIHRWGEIIFLLFWL